MFHTFLMKNYTKSLIDTITSLTMVTDNTIIFTDLLTNSHTSNLERQSHLIKEDELIMFRNAPD